MSNQDLREELRRIDELYPAPPNYTMTKIKVSDNKYLNKPRWYRYKHTVTFTPEQIKTLEFLNYLNDKTVYALQPCLSPTIRGISHKFGKTMFLFSVKKEGNALIPYKQFQKPPKKPCY